MTEQEYNRVRMYEQLRKDIYILEDAAIIATNSKLSPYSAEEKYEIFTKAIALCKDEIPALFRRQSLSLQNELKKL